MRSKRLQLILWIVIILIGILLLLHNLQLFYLNEQLLWGSAIIVLGGIFIRIYKKRFPKRNILILGIIFLIIGLITTLDSVIIIPDDLIVTIFLWSGSAIFISIYIHRNESWWTIIPAGVLMILGIIVTLDAFHLLGGDILWFIFLLGMSLIFWFLFLIKDDKNNLDLAQYPALFFTIFSFYILSFSWKSLLADILLPISIITCGFYLMMKNI